MPIPLHAIDRPTVAMDQDHYSTNEDSSSNSVPKAEPDKEVFRILDLPPELRNKIYRATLVSEGVIETSITGDEIKELPSRIALLHVCLQIRSEAYKIFWQENTFRFLAYTRRFNRPFYFDRILFWLNKIGKANATLISNVVLEPYHDSEVMKFTEACAAMSFSDISDVQAMRFDEVVHKTRTLLRGIPGIDIQLTQPRDMIRDFPHSASYFYELHKMFNSKVKEVLSQRESDITAQTGGTGG